MVYRATENTEKNFVYSVSLCEQIDKGWHTEPRKTRRKTLCTLCLCVSKLIKDGTQSHGEHGEKQNDEY